MFNIHSLRVKLIFTICIIFLMILLVIFFYLNSKIQKKYIEKSIIYQELFADQIVNNIEFYFQDGINKLEAIAKMPEIISMNKKELDDIIQKMDKTSQFFNYFFVLDKNAKWISFPSIPNLVGDKIPDYNMGWVNKTFIENKTVFLDPVKSLVGTLVSGFSTPIHSKNGEIIGLLRGVLNISSKNTTENFIKNIKIGKNDFSYLVSSNGWLLTHSKIKLDFNNFTSYDYKKYLPVQEVLKGKSDFVEYEYDGQTYIAVFRPIKITCWGIIVNQLKNDILIEARQEAKILTNLFIFGFVLIVIIFLFLIKLALNPLTNLIKNIKTGNIQSKQNFSKDEIGQLTKEFNSMYYELFKSKEKLIESEKHYKTIFNGAAEGILMADIDTKKFYYANPAICNMLGYTEKEFLKLSVEDIHPKKNMDDILKKFNSMASERKIIVYNIPCLRKDKKIIYVDISSKENINIKGKNYNVGFFTDVTERKKAEDNLKRYQNHLEDLVEERTNQLQEKNKELETFSYSVSHDLKTPLRHIQGYSNILFEEYSSKLDKEAIRLINIINKSTDKMANLIDDLLEYTKTIQHNINPEEIDVNELIRQIIKEFDDEINIKNIKINIQNLDKIKGDLSMIKQVFVNLISNAIKFTRYKNKPYIEIGSIMKKNKKEITYYIKDNGAGFDMKYMDKAFKVFQRLHNETEFQGTGIGLAIVKKIIDKHGGKLWAESKIDAGATFYFSLPVN